MSTSALPSHRDRKTSQTGRASVAAFRRRVNSSALTKRLLFIATTGAKRQPRGCPGRREEERVAPVQSAGKEIYHNGL